MNMLKNKFLSLILFFIITFSASFIGGLATISYKEPWYSQLVKSSYNPPDWIFAPVWTTLYLMMTFAIWLFWLSKKRDMNTIYIYFIHILFNTTWSVIFFAFHNILLALINLMILIWLIVVLILRYRRVNNVSAYLMIPYLLWSCYALFLNLNLLILN
jgi:tryptophan-rich sensory protein